MSESENIKNIKIDVIKNEFAKMKEAGPQVRSKKDLINDLAGDIKALLKQGYTLKQILDVLQSNGLELKESTLKNYLTKAQVSNQTPKAPGSQPAEDGSTIENTPAAPRRRRGSKKGKKGESDQAGADQSGGSQGNNDAFPGGSAESSDGSITPASDDV